MFKLSPHQYEWVTFIGALFWALLLPFAIPKPRTWTFDQVQTLRGRVSLFAVSLVVLVNLVYPGFFGWLKAAMHRAVYN